MEREAKRKAAQSDSLESERASKRQRLPGDRQSDESVENTSEAGLKFIETLKQAKDKTGRPIATPFLTLPSKKEIPEYYEVILLPLALDTLESKLKAGQYSSLSALESDVKRLVNNAKHFNDKKSLIYEDAERIRKTASNWMVKNNPAYKDSSYVAVATPIPETAVNGSSKTEAQEVSTPVSQRPRRGTVSSQPPPSAKEKRPTRGRPKKQEQQPEESKVEAEEEEEEEQEQEQDDNDEAEEDMFDFTGKTFQQAQDNLISGIIDYVEDSSGLAIFQPFVNLPTRQLKDYYQLIKKPTSLLGVQKRVRGIHGRNETTGVSDFNSWGALEDEMSFIWNNAKTYNEEGSDIYKLAEELEEFFKRKLADAKSKVEEPGPTTLKLKMPPSKHPSLKIRFGSKNSPGPDSNLTTPVNQKSASPAVVESPTMNGQRPTSSGAAVASPAPKIPSRSASASTTGPVAGKAQSPPVLNGVKSETRSTQSPHLGAIQPVASLPDGQRPPSSQSITPSGHIASLPVGLQQQARIGSPYPPPAAQPPLYTLNPNYENKVRQLGKLSAALLPNINLATHPSLRLPRPFRLAIPASPTLLQQSVTITLPQTHDFLQIVPSVPIALEQPPRPYRLFVTVNGVRLIEVAKPPTPNLNSTATVPQAAGVTPTGPSTDGGKEKGRPCFEGRLVPGVNRVEVEIVAATALAEKAGTPNSGGGSQDPQQQQGLQQQPATGAKKQKEVEWEKCTIFVNVMRG